MTGSRRGPDPTKRSPIEAVIEQMAEIASSLPPEDGIARFNGLYLEVTRQVLADTRRETFEDPRFVERLDEVFAELYFAAVDADRTGTAISRPWVPLFAARRHNRVAPIQFALAGMNAHINHDLALSLVRTLNEMRLRPARDSPQHRDYRRVDELLARVEERVKERFARGLIGVADEALGRLDDVVAMWSVARARDAAWTHAETLWAIRRVAPVREAFLLTLGRMVGLASRGLLVPVL
jgi:hypothetical protein